MSLTIKIIVGATVASSYQLSLALCCILQRQKYNCILNDYGFFSKYS